MTSGGEIQTEADLLKYLAKRESLAELIDGAIVLRQLGFWEAVVATTLLMLVFDFVRSRRLGVVVPSSMPFRMANGNVRVAACCFVRMDRFTDPAVWKLEVSPFPPDFVAEVVGREFARPYLQAKLADFFESGTRLVWLVDPATKTVEVYTRPDAPDATLGMGDILRGEPVLEGLEIAVEAIFRDDAPASDSVAGVSV